MYNLFITYLIAGLFWTGLFELLTIQREDRYLYNLERIAHLLLWPLWMIIFIVGWIIGFINGNKDNNDF